MEVISPAATFFPRIVFGIHGASSRGFLGGLLPVLRPANLPRGAVGGAVGDLDLAHLFPTSLSIKDFTFLISFFTFRCSPLILSSEGKVSSLAGTSRPASITPFRAAAIR